MPSDIHRTIQDNLVRSLERQGFDARKEVGIGHNRVDVFAENDDEIRIYEVVISTDYLKEFDKTQFSKPVRVFKVYPNLRKPFEKKHIQKPKKATKVNITLSDKAYWKLHSLRSLLKINKWADLIDKIDEIIREHHAK